MTPNKPMYEAINRFKDTLEFGHHLDRLFSAYCTRVVIAHRVSTIMNADLVVLLDGGTAVEQGSHPDLMAQDGQYAALIRGQR